MRIEAWRVSHGLDNPKGGSALIDKEFIESIQKEIRKGIKEKEEYKEKVYNLTIEVQGRLKELQKKAQTGAYWEEYNKSTDGVLYGQNVNYIYGLEKDNPDVLISRYREFLPEQLRQAGIDFSGVENSLGREITLEEYVNIMGPIWEIMREYRTIDDKLRDLSICLAIISIFAAPMAMTPGGAGTAKALDLTTGIADAGVSMLRGDTAGAALSLAIELLPEFLEDAARSGAKTIDSVDDIEVPRVHGTTETVAEAISYQVNRLRALGITSADVLESAGKSVAKVLDESGLSFTKFKEIIETPKPLRPAPSTYLDSSYITKHLSQFDNGGSYVMTRRQYENFVEGRPLLGREDNSLYIVPKEYMDSIATSANGNISVFEKRLGFSEGYFQDGGGLVRIDIKDPKGYNLRMATGNEAGANDFYTPGGFTSGGSPEAVVNNIPNADDFRTITFMN